MKNKDLPRNDDIATTMSGALADEQLCMSRDNYCAEWRSRVAARRRRIVYDIVGSGMRCNNSHTFANTPKWLCRACSAHGRRQVGGRSAVACYENACRHDGWRNTADRVYARDPRSITVCGGACARQNMFASVRACASVFPRPRSARERNRTSFPDVVRLLLLWRVASTAAAIISTAGVIRMRISRIFYGAVDRVELISRDVGVSLRRMTRSSGETARETPPGNRAVQK